MGTLSPVTKNFELEEATPEPSLLNPLPSPFEAHEKLDAGAFFVLESKGNSSVTPPRDYSVNGDSTDRVFGVFNAISIIATTYGNAIIPEIQTTLAPPVTGKMFEGLCVCYAVIVVTFFSVSVSGYWAFGNQATGTLISNFMGVGKPLVPK